MMALRATEDEMVLTSSDSIDWHVLIFGFIDTTGWVDAIPPSHLYAELRKNIDIRL